MKDKIALMCLGLIGPPDECRDVWRKLHESTICAHRNRGRYYDFRELCVPVSRAGIPVVGAMFVSRVVEPLPFHLYRSEYDDEPRVMIFRASYRSRFANALDALPFRAARAYEPDQILGAPAVEGVEYCIHFVGDHPEPEVVMRLIAAMPAGATVRRHGPEVSAEAVADAIGEDVAVFGERTGCCSSYCAY